LTDFCQPKPSCALPFPAMFMILSSQRRSLLDGSLIPESPSFAPDSNAQLWLVFVASVQACLGPVAAVGPQEDQVLVLAVSMMRMNRPGLRRGEPWKVPWTWRAPGMD